MHFPDKISMTKEEIEYLLSLDSIFKDILELEFESEKNYSYIFILIIKACVALMMDRQRNLSIPNPN